jgi:hypothetical protein
MNVWKIIRDHVNEFKELNKVELGDQSWQIFKRMEEAILAFYREGECKDLRAEVDALRAEIAALTPPTGVHDVDEFYQDALEPE